MDEQRLRRALREHAARLPADRPPADRLIGRARRRTVAVLAVAILFATAGAVVGLTALDSHPEVVVGPGPTETREPEAAGSPSAGRASARPSENAVPAGPYRAFALYEDGSGVYALDLQTGQRPRRIDAAPTGEGIVDIAYSRPRDSLFVTVGETACRSRIFELSLADGSRREIGMGREIAVDPHGTRYIIARSTGGCGEEELAVELGSFDGATSHTWTVPVEEEGPVALSHLSWSQGEEYVAFGMEYGDGTEIHLLDVNRTDTASLEQATTELSPPIDRPVTWTVPAFRGSALTVVEGPAVGYEQEVDGWRVIEIDPPNRQRTRPIVGSDRAITHLDWGPAGHRLLYTLGHGVHDAEARPAQVRLWSDDGDDRPLPDGMRRAIWGANEPGAVGASPASDGCSAAGMDGDPAAGPALPDPVATTRRQIVQAAVTCDLDRVVELAGPEFRYGFDQRGSPARTWARQEDSGQPVLRRLVELLRLDHASDGGSYWWPRAATTNRTDADWTQLEGVYGPTRVARWRELGTYLGHRIQINEDGTWRGYWSSD